jgi:hypothetical protein
LPAGLFNAQSGKKTFDAQPAMVDSVTMSLDLIEYMVALPSHTQLPSSSCLKVGTESSAPDRMKTADSLAF